MTIAAHPIASTAERHILSARTLSAALSALAPRAGLLSLTLLLSRP